MLESTHTKADDVKNPPHVMQNTSDLGLFLKLPFASILMAKLVLSKPTQDILALFYTCEISITFRLSWASAGCFWVSTHLL